MSYLKIDKFMYSNWNKMIEKRNSKKGEQKDLTKDELREKIANILRDNITFSGQIGNYVIHGAIEKIAEEIEHRDNIIASLKEVIANREWELDGAVKRIRKLAKEK